MSQVLQAPGAAQRQPSTRHWILSSVRRIADQQDKKLEPLHDELPLLDSGLDSLCIAILVAVLDDELGIDPFTTDEEVPFPVTLGDFIALYEHAGR